MARVIGDSDHHQTGERGGTRSPTVTVGNIDIGTFREGEGMQELRDRYDRESLTDRIRILSFC